MRETEGFKVSSTNQRKKVPPKAKIQTSATALQKKISHRQPYETKSVVRPQDPLTTNEPQSVVLFDDDNDLDLLDMSSIPGGTMSRMNQQEPDPF